MWLITPCRHHAADFCLVPAGATPFRLIVTLPRAPFLRLSTPVVIVHQFSLRVTDYSAYMVDDNPFNVSAGSGNCGGGASVLSNQSDSTFHSKGGLNTPSRMLVSPGGVPRRHHGTNPPRWGLCLIQRSARPSHCIGR